MVKVARLDEKQRSILNKTTRLRYRLIRACIILVAGVLMKAVYSSVVSTEIEIVSILIYLVTGLGIYRILSYNTDKNMLKLDKVAGEFEVDEVGVRKFGVTLWLLDSDGKLSFKEFEGMEIVQNIDISEPILNAGKYRLELPYKKEYDEFVSSSVMRRYK